MAAHDPADEPLPTAAIDRIARPWDDRLGRIAIRCAQLLIVGIAIVLAGAVVQRLWFVVVPLLLACIVSSAAWPLVRWLHRRGVSSLLSAVLALTSILAALAVLGLVVVGGVYGEREALVTGAEEGLLELERLAISTLPVDRNDVREFRDDLTSQASLDQARDQARAGALVVGEVLSGLVLLLVVTFFLLKDGATFGRHALRLVAPRHRPRVERIARSGIDVLGGFVRGTTVVAIVDAVLVGVGLALLDVPLALPLAVLVFMGAYVPIVGATVAGAVAALVALVTNGPATALVVVGLVLAVNQLEGNLLAPVVLGNAVQLHPLAVLVAIASGFILAGVLGALLSVPLLAFGWTVARSWNVDDPAAEPDPVRRSGSG